MAMTPEQQAALAAAIKRRAEQKNTTTAGINDGIGPMQSFAIGAGRGMTTLARGVGLAEPEDPLVTAAYQDLQTEHPVATGIGEVAGQAAPFLLPGVGVGAIGGTGARIAASAGLGALEGGIITKGQGGEPGDIATSAGIGGALAGGMEAVFPMLNRFGGALVRRAFGKPPKGSLYDEFGKPSPELIEAAEKLGVDLPSLGDDGTFTLTTASPNADPEQAVRAARFAEMGIEPTQGNLTQNLAIQAQEERLSNMASTPAADPLRQRQLQQSEAFQSKINSFVGELGVSNETGALVKDALSGRLKDLKSRKNLLYKNLAKEAPDVLNVPIFTDSVAAAIPNKAELRRISRWPGNSVDGLNDLLVEFGVDQTPEAVEAFTKSGGEIIPLTIGTYEDFRQALNALASPTAQSSGERATAGVIAKLKGALDEEASFIESAVMEAGNSEGKVLDSLRQARGIVQTMKTEFSPQSIAGRLVKAKNDGVTPMIEASKAYDAIMGRGQPIEYLERTMSSLKESGRPGVAAIGALQAETVLRALDDALKAPSRKTTGMQTVGYPQFVKALNNVGEDRLQLLFKDNPRALQQLRTARDVAADLTVDSRATPRGSAPVLLDIANRFSRTPVIAPVVDAIKYLVNAGADERAVRKAMDSRPQMKRVVGHIQNDYPALASALGIAAINLNDEEQ